MAKDPVTFHSSSGMGLNQILAVHDHPYGDGLHTACTQPARNALPEERDTW